MVDRVGFDKSSWRHEIVVAVPDAIKQSQSYRRQFKSCEISVLLGKTTSAVIASSLELSSKTASESMRSVMNTRIAESQFHRKLFTDLQGHF